MMAFVQLDLFNFTESLAEESEYVLTSPRSLQACARHGIKPVELLPKSLEEFIEENDVKAFNKDVVDVMHKKSERGRLKKLRLCREERERIIDEQEVQKFSRNDVTDSEDENSIENLVLDEDTQWHSLTAREEEEGKTPRKTFKDKPSILSFLESSHSPRTSSARMRMSRAPHTLGKTSDLPTHTSLSHRKHFKVLSGSESDEDNIFGNHSPRPVSKNVLSDRPPSSRVSARRLSSGCAEEKSIKSFVGDLEDSLPETLRKDRSLVSEKDKRLLEIMMLKTKEESLANDLAASLDRENTKSCVQLSKKTSTKNDYLKKLKERDQRHRDIFLKKQYMDRDIQRQHEAELNTKNSKWEREFEKQMNKKKHVQLKKHVEHEEKKKRQEDNLQKNSRGNQIWNEITYEESLQKHGDQQWNQNKRSKSSTDKKKQQRIHHTDLMVDIEDKHLRAQAHFQQQMRQKEMERTLQKMKEEERKKYREKQTHVMNKDLQMWQKELQDFQSINSKRADQIVGKKNAVKSLKAHNKRLQKELDHAALKARLDEEEKLRRDELQAVIDLKNQRSRLIYQEKEDFARAGREAARASRSIRENIKEHAVKSSFDKMAAEAEKIARIEKLGQTQKKPAPYSVQKSRTTLTLG